MASRDREGRWTRHQYNRLLERVITQDAALRTTQSQWCRCGQLRRFVDDNGNVTEWQRDEARVKKKINADGSFETHAYDFSGRLVSTVDPMGRSLSTTYAFDNRVSKCYEESPIPILPPSPTPKPEPKPEPIVPPPPRDVPGPTP